MSPARTAMHFALLVLCATLCGCSERELPPLADIMLRDVPDMPQQGPVFDARYENDTLCGPVAVSNSLAWLKGGTTEAQQIELVNYLAHYRYMGTRPTVGTNPLGLMHGLEKYLAEQALPYASVSYAGVRDLPEKYLASAPFSIQWLHARLAAQSAIWLNLGWYSQWIPGIYEREGGHWVTLVGFRNGRLVIHDPGPWQELIEPLPMKLRENSIIYEQQWKLAPLIAELEDFPSPRGGRTFIDGAVVLELDN
ncbi:MAG: hypothetical protein ACI9JM_000449 [Halioglobus sp.]|jgi:hypothetical protein